MNLFSFLTVFLFFVSCGQYSESPRYDHDKSFGLNEHESPMNGSSTVDDNDSGLLDQNEATPTPQPTDDAQSTTGTDIEDEAPLKTRLGYSLTVVKKSPEFVMENSLFNILSVFKRRKLRKDLEKIQATIENNIVMETEHETIIRQRQNVDPNTVSEELTNYGGAGSFNGGNDMFADIIRNDTFCPSIYKCAHKLNKISDTRPRTFCYLNDETLEPIGVVITLNDLRIIGEDLLTVENRNFVSAAVRVHEYKNKDVDCLTGSSSEVPDRISRIKMKAQHEYIEATNLYESTIEYSYLADQIDVSEYDLEYMKKNLFFEERTGLNQKSVFVRKNVDDYPLEIRKVVTEFIPKSERNVFATGIMGIKLEVKIEQPTFETL